MPLRRLLHSHLLTYLLLLPASQAAYAYYVIPALIMWERLIKTHKLPFWIRLPSRLPVSLGVWLFAMAFPFYSTINSL